MPKQKKKNSKAIKKVIFIAAIILTIAFIFSMSNMPKDESLELSNGFAEKFGKIIKSVLSVFIGNDKADAISIRKLAHFAEYMLLGIEGTWFAVFLKKINFQAFCNVALLGIATAVCDESIQILSHRGPQVQDILLDCTGFGAGILAVAIIYATSHIIKKLKK